MNARRKVRDREYRMVPVGSAGPAGHLAPVRLLALSEGFAMVRRRGAAPFVISEEKWAEAEKVESGDHD